MLEFSSFEDENFLSVVKKTGSNAAKLIFVAKKLNSNLRKKSQGCLVKINNEGG